ncbi:MAG: TraB/GumN family protein, partial [bacterium]|nr:TraB/GumN family protein [bacterium]
MLKKIVSVLIIAALSTLAMWGQNKTDSTNKGFFWEIEYNNQKSYMLASIGYFKKELYPVRNVVKDNFAKSEIL